MGEYAPRLELRGPLECRQPDGHAVWGSEPQRAETRRPVQPQVQLHLSKTIVLLFFFDLLSKSPPKLWIGLLTWNAPIPVSSFEGI